MLNYSYKINYCKVIMFSSWHLRFYQFFIPKLVRFIQLQLFLTVFSLPILISWGLPISLMSCIGNFIFSPFLALFLFISCLLFFFELFYIPNGWLVWCLELLTKIWSWLISQGSPAWLIGFIKPSLWVLLFFPVGGFLIMHYKKLSNPFIRSICFLMLLCGATFFLKNYPKPKVIMKQIPCNNGFVTIIKAYNTITVIDPGVIGQRVSKSWIEYTLLKELMQSFGTATIDHFIIARPGILTFDYCAQLCRLAKVTSLYLVLWEGDSDKKLLNKYGRLRYELEQKKGTMLRINNYAKTLVLEKNTKIIIEPLETCLHYKEITFPALQITLHSDKLPEPVIIYSTYYANSTK